MTKKNGWFSNRHQADEAYRESSERWYRERSPEAKRRAVDKRADERAERSPQQQLTLLDERLGKGQGAEKERAQLEALVASN